MSNLTAFEYKKKLSRLEALVDSIAKRNDELVNLKTMSNTLKFSGHYFDVSLRCEGSIYYLSTLDDRSYISKPKNKELLPAIALLRKAIDSEISGVELSIEKLHMKLNCLKEFGNE